MSLRWVAATTRGRGLVRRRLGADGVGRLAASTSLSDALDQLSGSAYGPDVGGASDAGEARRSVTATAIWHLRVLAGWLPPGGAGKLRALAGWYEAINIERRLAALAGVAAEPRPYGLGALSTSWGRLAGATSTAELRRGLAASPWGDPGSDEPEEAGIALRMSWADRLAIEVPQAAGWAAARAAILAAVSVCSGQQPVGAVAADAERLVGRRWQEARSVPDLAAAMPRSAAWPLAGISGSEDLWRAEPLWWRRVGDEGLALAKASRPGPAPVVGVAAALMADAWQVGTALELAARGGREQDGALG